MLSDAQIHRLLDIANTGCTKGFVNEARDIYEGVLAVRPGHVPAQIGEAFSHLVVDEFDAAEQRLAAILEQHPEDRDASAMLGLCYTLGGKKDKAEALLDTLKDGQDSAAGLAAALLDAAR